ncbi:catalase family peroxidase [Sphingomonas sp. H39-1-10]|uniref:catalase family peroxidase n=1 Tax=Sphingomonas pollutisoli TaxID=3030829 RepID=UPI0023B9C0A1|nr:catalase family peroxidase [Sphingomonas pollutisoli]MDF0490135.1 catalase family peroxidase [Sphingomonas pollutisoli]
MRDNPPPPPLAPYALIAAIVLLLATGLAWAAGWIGPKRLNGGDVADALEQNAGGVHPGYRRAHSKGLCLVGDFQANGAGAALTKASIFARGDYPVFGRFSLAGGNPLAIDGRNVFHSMALILRTPDGQEWRTGMNHTPIFPVADPQSFVDLQLASTPDPKTGKPDPALMKAYLARHPETKAFQDYIKQAVLPNSFANATYYSINAFRFSNAAGETRFVRWQMIPETAVEGLDKAKLDSLPRDYLFKEMVARTAKAPSRWHLVVVVANPGDVTNKATVAWTGAHRTVDVGTLTVSTVNAEEVGNCRDVNFDPTVLPAGMAPSDDPLLAVRAKVYSTSFGRRASENPGPSAIGKDLHAGESVR